MTAETLFDAPNLNDGWATLSDDGVYRKVLGRRWGASVAPGRRLLWVMLNPSTADATTDDMTVTKCIEVSRRAGYDELVIVNLFAFRTTYPDELVTAARTTHTTTELAGPGNSGTIADEAANAHGIVVAWGANIDRLLRYLDYDPRRTVLDVAARQELPLYCLGYTAGGHPKHPCRLAYSTPLIPFDPPRFHGTA